VRDGVSLGTSHGVPRNPSMRNHQKGARPTKAGQLHVVKMHRVVVTA
jgi:hypothetical protein